MIYTNDRIGIGIQEEPLAFVFEKDDGTVVTGFLDVPAALCFALQFVECPSVYAEIRLPAFLKRLLVKVLRRSWQRSRKEHWQGGM